MLPSVGAKIGGIEFDDVIRKRRMVRNYSAQPVAREVLERIVDAGLRAPSAGNSQGFGFIVVTETAGREAIADLAGEGEYVEKGFDPWISRAPAHIVITISEQAYHDRYREQDKLGADGQEMRWPVPFWWVDAGAAMMSILLAAVNEDLAAGFLGIHAIPELAELLSIPGHHTPIGIITLGHPLADRRSASLDRGKRPRDSIVHFERWQG